MVNKYDKLMKSIMKYNQITKVLVHRVVSLVLPFNKNGLFWNKNHTDDIILFPSSYFLNIYEERPISPLSLFGYQTLSYLSHDFIWSF